MNPKVSVVMPVFNGGQYFAAALGSVIAQDYDNIEIIVVDDGSTDDSWAEITDLEAADARVRIPMVEGMRSLNVAVSAAMVMGEALRQIRGNSAGA